MTTEKLHELLGAYLNKNAELKKESVEIALSEPAIGSTRTAQISSLSVGFDWDYGRLLITPDIDLVRASYITDMIKNKRAYKIVKCTDLEMRDKESYNHRIGKIVSDPIIDKKCGRARMNYLYDVDGNTTPFGKELKTSPVSQIIRSFKDCKETMCIITENSYIFLEEINCPM